MCSDVAGRTGATESDAHSRLRFIPEFGKIHANVKVIKSGDGGEFNFAAKHFNVTEILAESNEPLLLASKGPVRDEYLHESTITSALKSSSDVTRDSQGEETLTLQESSRSAPPATGKASRATQMTPKI